MLTSLSIDLLFHEHQYYNIVSGGDLKVAARKLDSAYSTAPTAARFRRSPPPATVWAYFRAYQGAERRIRQTQSTKSGRKLGGAARI